jgi:hypothetical protein
MLSLQELKKIDPAFEDLSDPQLRRLRAKLYALGELAFDFWADNNPARKSVSKNPVGVVTLPKGNITM